MQFSLFFAERQGLKDVFICLQIVFYANFFIQVLFGRLGSVNFGGIDIVFCFCKYVAFLQVFVYLDFQLNSIAGDFSNGPFLEFFFFKKDVNDFLVGAVVGCPENVVANHDREYSIFRVYLDRITHFKHTCFSKLCATCF